MAAGRASKKRTARAAGTAPGKEVLFMTRSFYKKTVPAALAALLAAGLLTGCTGKQAASPSPSTAPAAQTSAEVSPSPSVSPAVKVSKADIEKQLKADKANLLDVTWSPDNSAVVYLRTGTSGANICIWKVDHEKELVVRKARATLNGFLWSPDSSCFLIEIGHADSSTTTSSIVEAKTLKQLGDDVTTANVSAPVLSPDGKYLALSTIDEGSGKADLSVYALASKNTVSVVSETGAKGAYVVEYWKGETIGYTTLTASGERAEQTVLVGD